MKMTVSNLALAVSSLLMLGATTTRAASQVNVPAPTITAPENVKWFPMIPQMGDKGPAMAVVSGEPGVIGKPFAGLFRVPAGGVSPTHIHSSDYWAVMLSGTESARVAPDNEAKPIAPGGYWFQPGKAEHINKCLSKEDCVFFVYYPNGMDYVPVEH
ncbi:hypothetical protein ACQR1I_31765 [Bradyrhizobium sp. HKCCYLS2038]|uniref:hypothetical protein n=1 Tax=unclassified Bradyrhizobium TaxID=2631580 RepID=UPI003EB695F1